MALVHRLNFLFETFAIQLFEEYHVSKSPDKKGLQVGFVIEIEKETVNKTLISKKGLVSVRSTYDTQC